MPSYLAWWQAFDRFIRPHHSGQEALAILQRLAPDVADYPRPDVTIARIDELTRFELPALIAAAGVGSR